jgi:hypothetical protein
MSLAMLVVAPGTVLHHERLAEVFRELRREEARHDVGAAAGREADQNSHRARRVALRSRGCGAEEQERNQEAHREVNPIMAHQ